MAEYSLTPVQIPPVKTANRTICTALPVPESLGLFERLRQSEPRSMSGQPPIVWHSAKGFHVEDRYGNRWIDWSSGVLITNAGTAFKIDPYILDVTTGVLIIFAVAMDMIKTRRKA